MWLSFPVINHKGTDIRKFLILFALASVVAGETSSAPVDLADQAHHAVRISVSGLGYVASEPAGVRCGSIPPEGQGPSTRCVARMPHGTRITFTAVPWNPTYRFDGWLTESSCGRQPVCTVKLEHAKWIRARFVPVRQREDVCASLGLVGDRKARRLSHPFPRLKVGGEFIDPAFGTRIRRISDVIGDGRGLNAIVKPAYSTIAAWNADESLMIVYRTGGTGGAGHELLDGKSYAFLRRLDDLPMSDLEHFYWDPVKPEVIHGIDPARRLFVRYQVYAPEGKRTTVLRDFTAQCGRERLKGSPYYPAWNGRVIGLTCGDSGPMFAYDVVADKVHSASRHARPKGGGYGVQSTPSGSRLFFNQPDRIRNAIRIFDLDMRPGPTLDMGSGDEHAATSLLSDGSDVHLAVQFDPAPDGTGIGSLVQWNLAGQPNANDRIPGRVLIGRANGYPYPPKGTHIGSTAYHRTGLTGLSIKGTYRGDSLLDGELLYVDVDPVTNPAGSVCRVGHHRTTSSHYFAEPHVSISPSGTRLLFGSSWGDASHQPIVDAFVVELPGYRP